jgi:hypothetical protein
VSREGSIKEKENEIQGMGKKKGVRIMEAGRKKKDRDRGSKNGHKKREINIQRMIGGEEEL